MVKKLDNKQDLKERSKEFDAYLKLRLDGMVLNFLESLCSKTKVFVFSGLIRNFFINPQEEIRDLDLVLEKIDDSVQKTINNYTNIKNSFGGYKLEINSLNIDLWEINNTWAFTKNKVNTSFFKELNLPDTSFFNFSSIIYNYNTKEFFLTDNFKKFIETKELDYVLKENPYPELCIINTIYYKEKFNLNVSIDLKKYYLENFFNYDKEDFEKAQLKHFDKVLYPYGFLKTYYNIFYENIKCL